MPRISAGTGWSSGVTEAVAGFFRRLWRSGVEFGESVRTLRRRARMPFRVSIQVAALATFVLVTTVLVPSGHTVVASSSAADAQLAAFTAASPSQDPLGLTWWDRSSGAVSTWLLNGSGTVLGYQALSKTCGTAGGCSDNWIPLGLADVNGDGNPDLVWWDPSSGAVSTWLLNGSGTVLGYQALSKTCGTAGGCSDNWIPLGLADVNGDGHPDLVWWDPSSGAVSTWLLNGSGTVLGYQALSKTCGTAGGCSDNWHPSAWLTSTVTATPTSCGGIPPAGLSRPGCSTGPGRSWATRRSARPAAPPAAARTTGYPSAWLTSTVTATLTSCGGIPPAGLSRPGCSTGPGRSWATSRSARPAAPPAAAPATGYPFRRSSTWSSPLRSSGSSCCHPDSKAPTDSACRETTSTWRSPAALSDGRPVSQRRQEGDRTSPATSPAAASTRPGWPWRRVPPRSRPGGIPGTFRRG